MELKDESFDRTVLQYSWGILLFFCVIGVSYDAKSTEFKAWGLGFDGRWSGMVYILLIAGIFWGDLHIKNYVEKKFPDEGEQESLRGFLLLRKHHNRGAFLNIGQGQRPVVAALSVCLTVFAAVLFVLTLGTKGNAPLKAGLAMLLGGAFSNTYDRLKRKYVVDYFSFGVRWKRLSRIIFNISDFGIILGALTAALSVGCGAQG